MSKETKPLTASDVLSEIDRIAREYDNYDYGFPTHTEDSVKLAEDIINRFAAQEVRRHLKAQAELIAYGAKKKSGETFKHGSLNEREILQTSQQYLNNLDQ